MTARTADARPSRPPRWRRSSSCWAACVAAALASCNGGDDDDAGALNEAPTVTITAPTADDVLFENFSVPLRATVGDVEDTFVDLRATWLIDGDPVSQPLVPNVDGEVFLTVDLDQGERVIGVIVYDTGDLQSSDELVVTVRPPNYEPTCGVTEPDDGVGFALASPALFRGFATDPDDPILELLVSWTSDLDGLLGDDPPDETGEVRQLTGSLSAGDHVIALEVSDGFSVCRDTVYVSVSHRPVADIETPFPGAEFEDDDAILLSGTVSDEEDGTEGLSVAWSSDLDGDLGTTTSSGISGYSEVVSPSLSVGEHLLRMQVTDSDGVGGADEVTVTIVPAAR